MSRVTLDLACPTHPDWAPWVLQHFDDFLADHANLERKASAQALSLVVKYAHRTDIVPPLIELAREELEHFEQVYAVMAARGLRIVPDSKDPYVNALIAECRSGPEERFLDRMLVNSIIETRGAERFRLLTEALDDPALQAFYRALWAAEAKHGNLFVRLALRYVSETELYPRLQALLHAEARIVERLPWRPSLH